MQFFFTYWFCRIKSLLTCSMAAGVPSATCCFPTTTWPRCTARTMAVPVSPPCLAKGMLLLSFYEEVSDGEAVERAEYYPRWRAALDQSL
jgi:hypothetical protein